MEERHKSPIKALRALFGMTQEEFAGLAEASQATVSRWEDGEFEPNLKRLAKIRANALKRGLPWNDGLIFGSAPEVAAE